MTPDKINEAVELAKDISSKTVKTHHVTEPEITLSKALLSLKKENDWLNTAYKKVCKDLARKEIRSEK